MDSIKIFLEGLTKINSMDDSIYEDKQNEMNTYEKNKIQELSATPCSEMMSKLYESFYSFINYKDISTLAKTQFYNINVMKTMTCFVMSGLNSEQSYMDLLQDVKIAELGKDKEYMTVFFSNLLNGKDRVLTFKFAEDEILHEFIMGMNMNKIRSIIPTFTWTYGLTTCNLPLFVKSKNKIKMVSACITNVEIGKQDYIGLITEYIDGPTLKNYITSPSTSVKDLRSALLTIFYSIFYANKMINYVHWDLHTDNILMRKLDSNDNYIYLPSENKYLYVGSHLATIIDFGLNAYETKTKPKQIIGNYTRVNYGINPDASQSSKNDILKLLNYCYFYLKDQPNSSKFSEISKLFSYFTNIKNKIDLYNFHMKVTKQYGIFPNNVGGPTIDDFTFINLENMIQLITYFQPDLFTDVKPNHVLSCQGNGQPKCISENELSETIFNRKYDIQNITDLIGYREMLLRKPQKQKLIQFMKTKLNDILGRIEKIDSMERKKVVLETMLAFNDLRLLEKDLFILEDLALEFGQPKLTQDTEFLRKKIYLLVEELHTFVIKIMSQRENYFKNQFLVGKNHKTEWFNILMGEFRQMISRMQRYNKNIEPMEVEGEVLEGEEERVEQRDEERDEEQEPKEAEIQGTEQQEYNRTKRKASQSPNVSGNIKITKKTRKD
jgi:hypothetical protein